MHIVAISKILKRAKAIREKANARGAGEEATDKFSSLELGILDRVVGIPAANKAEVLAALDYLIEEPDVIDHSPEVVFSLLNAVRGYVRGEH